MQRYIYLFLLIMGGLHLTAQTYTLSGQVKDAYNNDMGGVSVELLDDNNEVIASQVIDCGVAYSFSGLEEGQSYSIQLAKEDSHLNGLSTFDLVLMFRHILGIDALSSAALIRAADLNDSGSVSVLDVLQLRIWILGISIELPGNTWLFTQETSGVEGPVFPIMLFSDQSDYNFTGIKRGDLNGSALPCE